MPYAFIGYSCPLEQLEEELEQLNCDEESIDCDPYLRAMLKFAEKYKAKVYWCNNHMRFDNQPCINREDDPGHPHVYFDVQPPLLEEARKAVKEFTPNMNCQKVDHGLLHWMVDKLEAVIE